MTSSRGEARRVLAAVIAPNTTCLRRRWQRVGPFELANKIIASCELAFADTRMDCHRFLAGVAGQYFEGDQIRAAIDRCRILELVADPINGWVNLHNDPVAAVKNARQGHFVIAGMYRTDFDPCRDLDHVAIVVGLLGSRSGPTLLPMCFSGEGGGPAAYGTRISTTFPMRAVHEGRIAYYSKLPEIEPRETPIEILFNLLRATRGEYLKHPMYVAGAVRTSHRRFSEDVPLPNG